MRRCPRASSESVRGDGPRVADTHPAARFRGGRGLHAEEELVSAAAPAG